MKFAEKIRERVTNPGGCRPLTIGFLGDSVTQGCFELYKTGKASFETEFRSFEAYHGKLKRILEELFPSVPVNIINAGVSGGDAVGGKNRLERDMISFHPDLVVVCFGLNDVNRGLEGLPRYREALGGIFQELKDAGTETIFLTPNTIGTRLCAEISDPFLRTVIGEMTKAQTEGNMDLYMAAAREICAEKEIPVCDCYAKWKKLEETGADTTRLLANRINHPQEKMHWLFAVSLAEMILDFRQQ